MIGGHYSDRALVCNIGRGAIANLNEVPTVADGNGTMITTALLLRYAGQSRSFTIRLANGRAIYVPHGELLYVNPKARRFVVETEETSEVFNLSIVTSIRRAKERKSG